MDSAALLSSKIDDGGTHDEVSNKVYPKEPEPYDDEREMTDQEFEEYCAALEATDGFDVPGFPNCIRCGIIVPLRLTEYTLEYLLPYSKTAIQGTNYEVFQVEKAMNEAVCGLNYYITFEAKVPDAVAADSSCVDATKTFEALVLMGIPKKKGDDATKVIFIREKGDRTVPEDDDLDSEDDEDLDSEDDEDLDSKDDEDLEAYNGEGASVKGEVQGVSLSRHTPSGPIR
ncbi:hypothetical protein COLO4_08085 [Corchorus olitorius]|uniref:Cystatin domain-containing protein n=1 Tax=Corchorus olitorius TaxID=93759 RepID=A0A1R3KHH7_9ROSI|nr:hypothetical protein COLO4_08085 [Corchorus olitorius]